MNHRIVILGGGPGGYEAALVAAEQGADVTVISREGLGGNSVLWDCVPSKAMIVSSVAMGSIQTAGRLGVHLVGGGDLDGRTEADLAHVMKRVAGLGRDQSADIEAKVAAAGATIVRGTGRLAGPDMVEVETPGGEVQAYRADAILVATGSNPRVLPFSRPDGVRVFTSRELFDLTEPPSRLVVVGSGVTGAEYAQAFAKMGIDVHLVSSREVILPSEDPDAARLLETEFERWGMTIHRKRRAYDMTVADDGVRVKVGDADGSNEEWIEASHALYCVGMVPNSKRLGLEAAGVQIGSGGAIPVDAVSRTNVRTVYAAGDVTGKIMLASVAAMQGRNAMYHALGMAVAPLRYDAVAACVFTSPQVATVGLQSAQLGTDVAGPVDTIRLDFAGNPRAKMEEATVGFVKIHARKGSGTVLGATVVAPNASDLITPLSVAVHNRLTVAQVASAFTIYPSMAGSAAEAARQLAGMQSARGMSGRPAAALLALLLLTIPAASCSVIGPSQVVVSATSSLAPAMPDLEAAFEEQRPDQDLVVDLDGTAAVVARTVDGSPAALLITDDLRAMSEVLEAGLGLGAPIAVASNALAIVVPAGNPLGLQNLDDLTDLDIALAVPETPLGAASQTALDAAGVAVEPVTLELSAQGVVGRVAGGDVQAGIAHRTDGFVEAVDALPLADAEAPPVRYEVLLLRDGGAMFLEFLVGDEAQEILRGHGYRGP